MSDRERETRADALARVYISTHTYARPRCREIALVTVRYLLTLVGNMSRADPGSKQGG